MSWLPNPFKSLQLYDEEESLSDASDVAAGGSVKEDLSVIGETIGRQLRGVAAFLAPPPVSSPSAASSSSSSSSSAAAAVDESGDPLSPAFARIRSDLAEISGSFKSSLSLLSNNKAVAEFSKMASNFLQLDEDEEEEEEDQGIGITDAVFRFVTEISERPECWTDFPLALNHDFIMSEAQAEHVSVIEQLVPSLAKLRVRLSSNMSASHFWMIYFILLLPRLNRDSVDLLSTPELVEARSTLLTMMLNKRNSPTPDSKQDQIEDSSQLDSKLDQDRHDQSSSGEKAAIADNLESLREVETKETAGKCVEEGEASEDSVDAQGHLKNDDDISFSDLEYDETDLTKRRYGSGRGQDVASSPDASSEWVQLNKNVEVGGGRSREGQLSSQNRDSEGEDSSDWLNIDEFDHDN